MGARMPTMCGHKMAMHCRVPVGLASLARLRTWSALSGVKPFQSTMHQRSRAVVRATDGDDPGREPSTGGDTNDPKPSQTANSNQQAQPSLVRGQTTAIITGAISILFGIAYLALVQFMDMRGGELLPPPPEAYLP